jgi:hypothetical protein
VKIWIDAQISPEIAQWFIVTHGIEAIPVKDLKGRNGAGSLSSLRPALPVVPVLLVVSLVEPSKVEGRALTPL